VGCSAHALRLVGGEWEYYPDWWVTAKMGPTAFVRDEILDGVRTPHSEWGLPNFDRGPDRRPVFVLPSEIPEKVWAPISEYARERSAYMIELLERAMVAVVDVDRDGDSDNDDVFIVHFSEEYDRWDLRVIRRNMEPWISDEMDIDYDVPLDAAGQPLIHVRDEFYENRRTYYFGPRRERVPFE
jgi:hypothetical protein